MENNILTLAYNLLQELGIRRVKVFPDHFEIKYETDNQAVIAYGSTEEELVENFYYLYQELRDRE